VTSWPAAPGIDEFGSFYGCVVRLFHRGKDGFNNLHTYDLDGSPIGKAIDHSTLPRRLKLDE
jgi:hypothetical protein